MFSRENTEENINYKLQLSTKTKQKKIEKTSTKLTHASVKYKKKINIKEE